MTVKAIDACKFPVWGVWILLLRRRDVSTDNTRSRTNLTKPAPFLVSGNAWFKYSVCCRCVEAR